MEGVATVQLSRRKPGELLRVELLPASGERPAILLDFVRPSPLEYAECEAIARENLSIILRQPQLLRRYGFPEVSLTEDQALGLRDKVFLVETAVRFWRDTNASVEGQEPGKITPELVAELVHDPFLSAAWHVHLTQAMALDYSEGNGSGASPNTSSGEAPPSAEGANEPPPPAPEDSPPEMPSLDGNAPESGSDPAPEPA